MQMFIILLKMHTGSLSITNQLLYKFTRNEAVCPFLFFYENHIPTDKKNNISPTYKWKIFIFHCRCLLDIIYFWIMKIWQTTSLEATKEHIRLTKYDEVSKSAVAEHSSEAKH